MKTTPKTLPLCALIALASTQVGLSALALHLTFDDPSDLLRNDGSGTIAWGGSSGITAEASGRFGGAGNFVQASQAWTDQGGTNLGTELGLFTVSMHIRQAAGGGSDFQNWQDFASFGDGNASVFRFEFNGAHNSASVYTSGTPGGGAVTLAGDAPPVVNDGAWHHLAMVSNGSTLEFFVNGTSKGSAAYAPTAGVALDAIQLAAAYGVGRSQNVQIDDLGIWNEALTPAQISTLSVSAIPEPSSALLLCLAGSGLLLRRRH